MGIVGIPKLLRLTSNFIPSATKDKLTVAISMSKAFKIISAW